jgi:hypothetical protein
MWTIEVDAYSLCYDKHRDNMAHISLDDSVGCYVSIKVPDLRKGMGCTMHMPSLHIMKMSFYHFSGGKIKRNLSFSVQVLRKSCCSLTVDGIQLFKHVSVVTCHIRHSYGI